MKKGETIRRYGIEAYTKQLEQAQVWQKKNKEKVNAKSKRWRERNLQKAKVACRRYREAHIEELRAKVREAQRKGGKYYERNLKYHRTGIQRVRYAIRQRHQCEFSEIKQSLAQKVELHHEWIEKTAQYRGVAFVDARAHRYGIIDVILLLDGEITLLTEKK